ncbi:MAG TPA: efflux RND transporter permease subunit [Candidatus Bathyarchaeia archaeon]|nr:efflux RND transporter permease subunit [Candidatus Bathyarchaeia archaeon]
MEKIILFLLKRKLIVFLCTFLIAIVGLGSVFSFNVALVPKANIPSINVSISGGSLPPEEMEDKVTDEVEKEIKSLAGVKDFSSSTGTGFTRININANENEGETVKQEVQNIVNRLRNDFPEGVDNITITQSNLGNEELIDYALVGADPQAMLSIAKKTIKDRLESVPGVKKAEVYDSTFQDKIAITLRPDRLSAYQLTPTDVIEQLQVSNWKQAVGTLENTGFDTVIMIDHTFQTVQEISDVSIETGQGSVPLSQLAVIEDLRGTIKDAVSLTDGKPYVHISVKKADGADLITTQEAVEQVVSEINAESGGKYEMKVIFEAVSFIKHAVSNLSRDVAIGGILAVIILLVFLRNWRVTLVIATTLPLSALMTFIAMKMGGYGIDLVTLISLSLSVGLIVDAAIVVLESIYHLREKGEPLTSAIVKGTREVLTPVIASQLTLVIVFLPLVFADFEDWLKPIFNTIAFTVTSTIVASTIAAIFFVPVFADRFLRNDKNIKLEGDQPAKEHAIVKAFNGVLRVALRHRIKTIAVAAALFIGVMFLAPFIKMGQGLNPNENLVYAQIFLPEGTPLTATQEAGVLAEKSLREVPEVLDVFFFAEKDEAEIYVTLVGKTKRERDKEALEKDIHDRLTSIEGIERITMSFGGAGEGAPIKLDVIGEDLETTRQITNDVEAMLKTIPGVTNVRNDFARGSEKMTLIPKQDALARLQVDHRSMLRQINGMIGEQQITTMTQDGLEVDVIARYPENWLKHPDQLRQVMIKAETGALVPLSELVDWKYSKSPITLRHDDGERLVTVSAEMLGTDLGTVGRQIEEKLTDLAVPAGYKVEIAGKLKEQSSNMTQGLFVFMGVLGLIYVIMVAQFGRMSQPLIIMFTIPMALVGVVIGFVLTQRIFGEMAMIGIIMLVGIVVSNAILLIDRINLLRSRGMDLPEAIIQGTRDRVRPVIMTKVTAILGMLPMGLAMAEGSDMEAPLATGVISGLIFHTIVTLVLVPVLYSLFESFHSWRSRRKEARRQRKQQRMAAKANLATTE